ncbi:hypothetical protein PIB30_006386 [Stylosanthes scabra]|uniref:Uncharacterized protein n=1 Tax=Stylosanthes scabra TaxID=79078 RepID=A0ABU6S3S2_9FABA|nr:hypothetical protein [Stylosanthes scabra]
MNQIGSVIEYFFAFLSYAQKINSYYGSTRISQSKSRNSISSSFTNSNPEALYQMQTLGQLIGMRQWMPLLNRQKGTHRPPPKPPNFTSDGGKDLRSLAHEIGSTTQSDGVEGLVASSGADAVAEGKVKAMPKAKRLQIKSTVALLVTPPMQHRAAPRSALQ